MIMIPIKLLTVPEVSVYLGVSRHKVYDLAEKGDLAHVKIGESLRFVAADIEAPGEPIEPDPLRVALSGIRGVDGLVLDKGTLLTVDEVCSILRVPRKRIWELVKADALPAIRFSKPMSFDPEDVMAFVERCRVSSPGNKVVAEIRDEKRRREAAQEKRVEQVDRHRSKVAAGNELPVARRGLRAV